MQDSTWWWVAAGIAVAVELGTGTFYLLMVAVGLAAGAVAAHAGGSSPAQLVVAGVVGAAAVAALHARRRGTQPGAANANPDVNPDIGETVKVDAWPADGEASVQYRGARWTAVAAPGSAREPGTWRIKEVVGNRLVIEKAGQENH